jgi:alpha-beta hydrolase superfamily lysophospholipase
MAHYTSHAIVDLNSSRGQIRDSRKVAGPARMKTVLSLVGVFLLGYSLLLFLVYVFQARLIYFPNIALTDPNENPGRLGLEFENVYFKSADGVTLHGWFVPAARSRAAVLFFHGNAGNITHRLDSISVFNQMGLSVFIFDYRGYGYSNGRPDEPGTYADADGAWNYLTHERGLRPEHTVIFGRSLGAAIASHLAARVNPAALIIESAFTSAADVAAGVYWFLPVRWLIRYRYDTQAELVNVRCPLLVIHSDDDEIIPVAHGNRLVSSANEPKTLLKIWGGHNDGFVVSEPVYSQGIDGFLQTHLKE